MATITSPYLAQGTAAGINPVAYGADPTDAAWLNWNYDPSIMVSSATPASGTVQAIRVNVRSKITATNVIVFQSAAGVTLTAGQNFAGLYTSAGVQVGVTADQSGVWNSGTSVFQPMALAGGPFTLTPGFYWVLLLANAATTPSWGRLQNQSATQANSNQGAVSARYATGAAGQTALPASFTPSTYLTPTAMEYWAGLS